MRKLPKAVIFDMDGVIIDSMPYHYLAWYEALRPFGIRASFFDIYLKEGERWDKTLKTLLKRNGIKPTKKILGEIFLERQKIFRRSFKRFVFRGANEILISLKKDGYLIGLVTGTPIQEVKKILPSDLKNLFDIMITGDQVKKGKPDPEPYLKAASGLGIRPDECVVIENAPLGVKSAKNAGMFCIALTTGLQKEFLKGADIILDDLDETRIFLSRLPKTRGKILWKK